MRLAEEAVAGNKEMSEHDLTSCWLQLVEETLESVECWMQPTEAAVTENREALRHDTASCWLQLDDETTMPGRPHHRRYDGAEKLNNTGSRENVEHEDIRAESRAGDATNIDWI